VARGWAEGELTALEGKGLLRRLEALGSPQGAEVLVGGRALVNFSSNDYLGLANDPALARAATEALARWGTGAGASRLLVGDTLEHRALEADLAAFEGTEAAVLFNAGYAANVGVLSALLGPEDVVFSDALNHASLIDGCRLSRARTVVYPHGDVAALRALLAAHPGRRRLVVTDTVFSMDGDVAPLAELAGAAREAGAALMVDEAHATGVLGPRGAGLVEALGLEGEVELRMGTLGKALGVYGAYVACSRPLADLLVNRARSLVFSTALPPAVCAAARAGLARVREAPELRERLWRHIRRFGQGLRALGFPAEERSAVFPVVLGAPEAALSASAFLRERGLLVKAVRPPTVPAGTSRLRFCLSAAHTDAHVDAALAALGEWARTRPG
jgi:8-amino-7-oxononanoate synthase